MTANANRNDAENAYLIKLRELLPQVRFSCGLPPYKTEREWELDRLAWFKILHRAIPLAVLETTIFDAIRSKSEQAANKDAKFVYFGPNHVLTYWFAQKEKGANEDKVKRLQSRSCICKRGSISFYNPVRRKTEHRPCPFHTKN